MDKKALITQLNERCEDIASTKFILADKKISNLLKLIALDGTLYALVESSLKNFNFELEFLKARTPAPGQAERFTLQLPQEPQRAVAFGFCLLMELDSKARDLQKFLDEYFYSDADYSVSFTKFVSAVIKPFSSALTELIKGAKPKDSPEIKLSPSYFMAETVNIDEKSLKTLAETCAQILTAIAAEKQLSAEERKEMTAVAEALMHSVLTKDKKLLRALYIGAKHTLKGFKNCVTLTDTIGKILKDHWVI